MGVGQVPGTTNYTYYQPETSTSTSTYFRPGNPVAPGAGANSVPIPPPVSGTQQGVDSPMRTQPPGENSASMSLSGAYRSFNDIRNDSGSAGNDEDDNDFVPDYEDNDDEDSETETLRADHREKKAAEKHKQAAHAGAAGGASSSTSTSSSTGNGRPKQGVSRSNVYATMPGPSATPASTHIPGQPIPQNVNGNTTSSSSSSSSCNGAQ